MPKQVASKGRRQSSIKTPSGGDSKGSTSDESTTQKKKSLSESDEPGPSTSGGRRSPPKRPIEELSSVKNKKRLRSTEDNGAQSTEEIIPLGEPEELGGYSLDQSEKFHPDIRKRRYYVGNESSKCDFNLQEGYDSFVRQEPCEGLKVLLEWVMNHKDQRGYNIYSLQENDFVCTRGLLTKMFSWSSVTGKKEPLAILVTKFRGIYFLSPAKEGGKGKQGAKTARRQPYRKVARNKPDPEQLIYWGWKFEQYVTAETPKGVPDTTKQVDEKDSYSIVVRRRLNEHSLVFAGEVDAFDARDGKYVELKTHGGRPKDDKFLRDTYILIKWWAQSYLLGIERIVCGFRNDMNGIVHTVKEYKTSDILAMIQDWKPRQGFQLLEACLQTVKNRPIKDDPYKAYLLTVGRDLTPSLVESPDHKTKGILTPEFIAWMQRQSKG